MLREFDHSELVHQEFTQTAPLAAEISSYLRKPKLNYRTNNHDFERLHYLDEFPLIKQLYLKYNCICATEADVERIFSFAGRLFAFDLSARFVPSNFYLSYVCDKNCLSHSLFIFNNILVLAMTEFVLLDACNLYNIRRISAYSLISFCSILCGILHRNDNAAKSKIDVR